MKIAELITKLEKYPATSDVVLTVQMEEDEDNAIYSVREKLEDGWLPSGVVAIVAEEFIGG